MTGPNTTKEEGLAWARQGDDEEPDGPLAWAGLPPEHPLPCDDVSCFDDHQRCDEMAPRGVDVRSVWDRYRAVAEDLLAIGWLTAIRPVKTSGDDAERALVGDLQQSDTTMPAVGPEAGTFSADYRRGFADGLRATEHLLERKDGT